MSSLLILKPRSSSIFSKMNEAGFSLAGKVADLAIVFLGCSVRASPAPFNFFKNE
jgi:hypothetical protein